MLVWLNLDFLNLATRRFVILSDESKSKSPSFIIYVYLIICFLNLKVHKKRLSPLETALSI